MLAAAKQLGMSRTSFKKLCRRNGLKKWPYRLHVVLLRLLHEPSVAHAARRQLSRGPPYVIDNRMLGCIKSSLKRGRKN
jgi:RWP-RK domain